MSEIKYNKCGNLHKVHSEEKRGKKKQHLPFTKWNRFFLLGSFENHRTRFRDYNHPKLTLHKGVVLHKTITYFCVFHPNIFK